MPEAGLRKGWQCRRFDDMAVMVNDRIDNPSEAGVERYVGLEHLDSDSLTIRRWGLPSDVEATKLRLRKGDIIFGRRRVYQRKLAVADFDGICSAHAMVLRAKPEIVLPRFLPFFMHSDLFMERAKQISVGSLSPTINWKTLAQQEFTVPPLDEQNRIVSMLETADRATSKLFDLLEASRAAEISLFSEMLTKCKVRHSPLGSLLTGSPRNGCSAPETSTETGHWVLALSAITKWGYKSGEVKSVEKTVAMSRAILTQGDLLISRSNTRELVGLPIVFDEERSDVSWPDTMMRLTPDESRVTRKYLELFLRSPFGRRQVQSYAAGTSASMKKINSANVRKIDILLPHLNEQKLIEDTTGILSEARKATQERMFELRDLHRLLIHRALAQGVENAQ